MRHFFSLIILTGTTLFLSGCLQSKNPQTTVLLLDGSPRGTATASLSSTKVVSEANKTQPITSKKTVPLSNTRLQTTSVNTTQAPTQKKEEELSPEVASLLKSIEGTGSSKKTSTKNEVANISELPGIRVVKSTSSSSKMITSAPSNKISAPIKPAGKALIVSSPASKNNNSGVVKEVDINSVLTNLNKPKNVSEKKAVKKYKTQTPRPKVKTISTTQQIKPKMATGGIIVPIISAEDIRPIEIGEKQNEKQKQNEPKTAFIESIGEGLVLPKGVESNAFSTSVKKKIVRSKIGDEVPAVIAPPSLIIEKQSFVIIEREETSQSPEAVPYMDVDILAQVISLRTGTLPLRDVVSDIMQSTGMRTMIVEDEAVAILNEKIDVRFKMILVNECLDVLCYWGGISWSLKDGVLRISATKGDYPITEITETVDYQMTQKVMLQFTDQPLSTVFDSLRSSATPLNMILGKGVDTSRRLTLRASLVELFEAVNVLSKTCELKYVCCHDVLVFKKVSK